jgi:predicted DNA-binding transcriptional regulator YafY
LGEVTEGKIVHQQILNCLSMNAEYTRSQIEDKLSPDHPSLSKTVMNRHLAFLVEHDYLSREDRGKTAYYKKRQSAIDGIRDLFVDVDSALALAYLKQFDHQLFPVHMRNNLARLFEISEETLAKQENSKALERWLTTKIAITPPTLTLKPIRYLAEEGEGALLNEIHSALLEERVLEVRYSSIRNKGLAKSKCLHPLGLVQHGYLVYLVAWDEEKGKDIGTEAITLYALTRFRSAQKTSKKVAACILNGWDIHSFLDEGHLGFPVEGEPRLQVELKVSNRELRYFEENRICDNQKITALCDKHFMMTLELPNNVRTRQWLLSGRTRFIVVKPVCLRDELMENMRSMLLQYELGEFSE